MIGVSIAMAIWTAGLQIAQRRSTQKRLESSEDGGGSETAKTEVIDGESKTG